MIKNKHKRKRKKMVKKAILFKFNQIIKLHSLINNKNKYRIHKILLSIPLNKSKDLTNYLIIERK